MRRCVALHGLCSGAVCHLYNAHAQTGEDYAYDMGGETSEPAKVTSEVEVAVEAGQEEGLEETLSNMAAGGAAVEDEGTAGRVSSLIVGTS